jgi:AcrR family transcriptional regulator
MASDLRKRQKEQTRQRILEAAMRRFADDGLTRAATADIARDAGVSHGTVFVHFPTLEALQQAAIEAFGEQVTARLHELATEGHTLREVLQAHLQGLVEQERFYTRLVLEGRLLTPQARVVLVGIQSVMAHHIGMAASREMELGAIRPMETHLLFNTWMGLVHYYLANGDLFSPEEPVLERCGPELLEHFCRLLRASI